MQTTGLMERMNMSSHSAICRWQICLHSSLVHHTLDCAPFAIFCLCCFWAEILPFIMAPRCNSDSSDNFCPRLWCYRSVSLSEWHWYLRTVCEFQLAAKMELRGAVGMELRCKTRTYCTHKHTQGGRGRVRERVEVKHWLAAYLCLLRHTHRCPSRTVHCVL